MTARAQRQGKACHAAPGSCNAEPRRFGYAMFDRRRPQAQARPQRRLIVTPLPLDGETRAPAIVMACPYFGGPWVWAGSESVSW